MALPVPGPTATARLHHAPHIPGQRPARPDAAASGPLLRQRGKPVIILSVASEARDIAAGDLASVAGRIKGVLGRMDDELVRSAVDYLELTKSDSRLARGGLPVTDLRMISWLGMPMYDADFSWGKPVAVMRAEANWGGHCASDGQSERGRRRARAHVWRLQFSMTLSGCCVPSLSNLLS